MMEPLDFSRSARGLGTILEQTHRADSRCPHAQRDLGSGIDDGAFVSWEKGVYVPGFV